MWKTTLNGLLAHKLRFVLTALAVFLGVAFMAGTLVLTDTVGQAFDDLFASANAGTDAVVREKSEFEDQFGQAVRSPIPATVADEMAAIDGVKTAEGNVAGIATIIGTPEEVEKQIEEGEGGLGRRRGGNGPPALGFNWPTVEALNPLRLVEGEAPTSEGFDADTAAATEAASAPAAETGDSAPLTPVDTYCDRCEIVVDKASADAEDLKVGDDVIVTTAVGTGTYELVGIVTFGSVDSPAGSSMTAWATDVAQQVMGYGDSYFDVRVVADDGVSQEELVDNISRSLEVRAGVVAGISKVAGKLGSQEVSEGVAELKLDLEVLTGEQLTEEDQNDIADQLGFFNTFLLVFAGVALFVGVFIIYNTFSIIVAQRTREMALLRAVGADRRQVLLSVMGEALIVGLLASALGLGAGIVLADVLQSALAALGFDLSSTNTVIGVRTIVASMVVGTLITLVSAFVPARKAAAVPPIAALRDVSVDTSGRSVARVAWGVGVVVLGALTLAIGLFTDAGNSIALVGVGAVVVFLGVIVLGPLMARPLSSVLGAPVRRFRGTPGTLARANAMRNPKRTSATAAALIIGVGLVGFITIFASSATASIGAVIDKAFLADFGVDSGSFGFGGLPPELADEIRQLPGVETVDDGAGNEVKAVSGIRVGAAEIDDSPVQVTAVDPATINSLFDVGVSEGAIEGAGPGDIFVLRDKAEEKGWDLGDTVTVNFARTGEQDLTIVAIYDEPEPAGTWTIPISGFEENFDPSQQVDIQVYVNYADDVDLEEAREQLEATVFEVAPNGEVQDQTELKKSITDQINQILIVIFALLALAVIIALLGIANSLALSIFERTREIGLLRAVGMTRSQVRTTIRWESVIISIMGTLIGLVVSLFFGFAIFQAIRDTGFEVFSVPVLQLAFIVLVAAVAGVVAAIFPARRASKLDVMESITTTE